MKKVPPLIVQWQAVLFTCVVCAVFTLVARIGGALGTEMSLGVATAVVILCVLFPAMFGLNLVYNKAAFLMATRYQDGRREGYEQGWKDGFADGVNTQLPDDIHAKVAAIRATNKPVETLVTKKPSDK